MTTTASSAAIRGTARADWTLIALGPLFVGCVCALAERPLSVQNALALAVVSACSVLGLVRRVRPWLGIAAIPGGLGLVVSRSTRIPLGWSDLARAGVVEHDGERGLAIELRDPLALAGRLGPDLARDLLRILRREFGPNVVDVQHPSIEDAMRRTRERTGFDLLFPERKLGNTGAAAAAAIIGQQIVRTRWHRAMSAQEAAAARIS
jgi:hypothetical protein